MLITLENITNLLRESLAHHPIGQTKSFIWLATPIGIAALCKTKPPIIDPPFKQAIKEGFEISLDLSREEKEFYETEKGLLLLFYS